VFEKWLELLQHNSQVHQDETMHGNNETIETMNGIDNHEQSETVAKNGSISGDDSNHVNVRYLCGILKSLSIGIMFQIFYIFQDYLVSYLQQTFGHSQFQKFAYAHPYWC